jgi:hypothetical protein
MRIMAKTKKGLLGIVFVISGALLLAVYFLADRNSQPASKQETIVPDVEDTPTTAPEVKEPAAAHSASTDVDPLSASETATLLAGKVTTLRQPIRKKTRSGEYVVLFEAGDQLEVVALQGTRIYLRTPEGETIGIPVEATDWITREDENTDQ